MKQNNPPAHEVSIELASFDSEESQRLMQELWREIDDLYGNEIPSTVAFDGMDDERAAFVIARSGGKAIGCGAIRPLTHQIAEVKRVYVRRTMRGRGVAGYIMDALEQFARDSGFSEIWLETGLRQPAAIRVYENRGYTRIAAFGDYKDDPLNVCYGRSLK